MYAIHKLIYQYLGTNCHYKARRLLAAKLANKSKTKSFNLAEELLRNPKIRKPHIVRLMMALNVPSGVLNGAVAETYAKLGAEYRVAYFKSLGAHVHVITHARASSGYAGVLAFKTLKIIQLSNGIVNKPLDRQFVYVQRAIKRYRLEHGDELIVFGKVIGFEYRPQENLNYIFSLKGEFLHKDSNPSKVEYGALSVGGRAFGLVRCHHTCNLQKEEQDMTQQGYDLIGDIRGHGDELM